MSGNAIERPKAAGRCSEWQSRAQFGPTLVEPMEMVLHDLAAGRGMEALPWIQDTPIRIQSVILEATGNRLVLG